MSSSLLDRSRQRARVGVYLSVALFATMTCVGCRSQRPKNVVLIIVDTLRADHLGLYGYERPTSPRIDAAARDGTVFEHAFATSSWTLPSVGSMLTGLFPSHHRAGVAVGAVAREASRKGRFQPLAEGFPTLAQLLSAKRFSTAAIMNNAFLSPRFGIDRGFEVYDHEGGSKRKIRRADEVVDRALEWLDAVAGGPFFLTLHLFDPHIDYDPPPPFRGRFSGKPEAEKFHEDLKVIRRRIRDGESIDWDSLVDSYDEEILFVDDQVGRFLDALASRSLGDDTVVILVSDHGEEFSDHGGFEHGHSMYNELLRVPLIIWHPEVPGGRLAEPVTLVDLVPTILDSVGQPIPGHLPGRSLLPIMTGSRWREPRLLIGEQTLYGPERRAAIRWPLKVISETRTGADSLFELENDFQEREDLATTDPSVTAELARRLNEELESLAAMAEGDEVELDEETLENLRSLGYID